MKFLHIPSKVIADLPTTNLPKYAFVSHCWTNNSALLRQTITSATVAQWAIDHRLNKRLILLPRIIEAARIAIAQGIEYLWIDWLCIDLTSSASVEEGINGSFNRLKRCSLCIVYLDDLILNELKEEDESKHQLNQGLDEEAAWGLCQYWTRSWTLSELIIPDNVQIYDASWNLCGNKSDKSISHLISNITSIPEKVIANGDAFWETSLAARISWAAHRKCRREEDTAYSLLGLLGITMQIRYGEGSESAFIRLQQEILRHTSDGSILAWRSQDKSHQASPRGLLAHSPREFQHFAKLSSKDMEPWEFNGKIKFNSRGVQIQSRVHTDHDVTMLHIGRDPAGRNIAIYIAEWNKKHIRICPEFDTIISNPRRKKILSIPLSLSLLMSCQVRASNTVAHLSQKISQHHLTKAATSNSQTKINQGAQVIAAASGMPIRLTGSTEDDHVLSRRGTDSTVCGPEDLMVSSKRDRHGRFKPSIDIQTPTPDNENIKSVAFDDAACHIVDGDGYDYTTIHHNGTDGEWGTESDAKEDIVEYPRSRRRKVKT